MKEWACSCGKAFEALAPICPRCGLEAARAFRTPVSINNGRRTRDSAKAIDSILEQEFARQGITNFWSGHGAENKVEYHSPPGVYSSQLGGGNAPVQPPIAATFVPGGLTNPQLAKSLVMDGEAWTPPKDVAAAMVKPGAKVGSGLNPNQVRAAALASPPEGE